MSDDRDNPTAREGLPGCPNCGSNNVERTPAREREYQCIDCGDEFDEGGRGVIV